MKKGLMIVISGPAGSGKGTVNAHLLATGEFVYSVSATTRAPRPGEVDGVNYHFISREEFERRISTGDMLEYTEYCGNYYGTLVSEFDRAEQNGKHLILEIEVDGATQIKKKFPEAVLVMVTPPENVFSLAKTSLPPPYFKIAPVPERVPEYSQVSSAGTSISRVPVSSISDATSPANAIQTDEANAIAQLNIAFTDYLLLLIEIYHRQPEAKRVRRCLDMCNSILSGRLLLVA